MSDQAMLGYVIHFAHDAGRKGRLVTPELVEEVLAEAARHVARKEIRAYRVAEIAEPAETSPVSYPGHDIEERNVLLVLRRIGPCQALAIADVKGLPPMRVRRVMQRLCAKGLAEPYMGSMFKITNAGIVSALESGEGVTDEPARDPGACRFPPSWGQELGD